MTVNSMTGFSRVAGSTGDSDWVWEAKSVNGRGLDLRCRVPPGYQQLEQSARKLAGAHFSRGNINIHLSVTRSRQSETVAINEQALQMALGAARRLKLASGLTASAGDLLAVRGVVETAAQDETDEEYDERMAALEAGLGEALEELNQSRRLEGGAIGAVIGRIVEEIAAQVEEASRLAAEQPEIAKGRLLQQLDELLSADRALPEERIAQEVALLATKSDVREEIDRLHAHIAAARELLGAGGVIGRKLDFLTQEFNREANTLCSKSATVELTRIGMDIKTSIDQLREQCQNIE